MIYCPKCGTANQRGSRFCNECGEPLPMHTALRCPMCGTMNPVGNVYCDRCHARLTPMAASPPGGAEREEAPVKGISLPTIPLEEQREQQVRSIAEEIGAEEKAEDWLTQLRASDVATETGAVKVETQETEEKEPKDWLTQLRALAVEEVEGPEATDELIEPTEIPDWLRDMGPIGVETETTPTEGQPSAEAPWEEKAPAKPPTAVTDVAERLQELVPAEVPDWLQEIAPPEATPAEPVVPSPESVLEEAALPASVTIPDWLRDMGPIGVETETTPAEGQPSIEAPWEEEAPAMPPTAVTAVAERLQELVPAEAPDWLQEIAPPEAVLPEAAPPPVEAVPAEAPDWLQEIAPPEAVTPEAPPPPVEAIPAEAPDWLQEIAPPEAVTPEAPPPPVEAIPAEVPDWLQEIAPPEAVTPEAPPPPVEAIPAEVPDWLQEIALPEEAVPETAPTVAEVAAPSVPPLVELPTEAEIPEAPEWLSELEAEPAPPSAPTVPVFEGITPSLPPGPGAGLAEAEDLARAEIPDWLEAMRPGPEAAAEEEPAETEGLLEGLRGVLAPTSAIEAVAAREIKRSVRRALPTKASEVSLARAQLLQGLLAQPAQAPQPQARKRGASVGERAQRWLVTVVLLVAVVGILASPTIGLNIPTLTQPITSSGATRLYNTVQGVSTGNTVLVAFEYGPAEANELNLVAEPILQHLLDQGAHISIVSTRPEGLAMGTGLLSHIKAPEEQYTRDDYRPGDATGVLQLLTGADTYPKLILVLTAQPGPLRWWVEQSQLQARGTGTPSIVAGLSAALEPSASPYLDASAGQLGGAISGLSGAAAYETLRGSPAQATQRLNALTTGHVAIVGLMILGAIFYALGGLRGRKK